MVPAPPYTEHPPPLPPAAPAPARRTPGMSFVMLCILCVQIATVVLLSLCVEALISMRKTMKSGAMEVYVRNSYQTPLPTPMVVRLDTDADQIPLQVEVYGIPNVRVVEDTPPEETGTAVVEDIPPVETGTVPSETGIVEDVPPQETGDVLVG